MSLKINNRATPKQIKILKDMGYLGKWDLSTDEAAQVITELFEERRALLDSEEKMMEQYGHDQSNKFGD